MNNGPAAVGSVPPGAPLPMHDPGPCSAVPVLRWRRAALPLWSLGGWVRGQAANPRRLVGLILAILVLAAGAWIVGWRAYGWYHLRAGNAALQVDHCRVALEHFQASLRVWPEDADVLLLTARAARRRGDLATAEHFLSQCEAAPAVADRAILERVLLRAMRGELDEVESFCRAARPGTSRRTPHP